MHFSVQRSSDVQSHWKTRSSKRSVYKYFVTAFCNLDGGAGSWMGQGHTDLSQPNNTKMFQKGKHPGSTSNTIDFRCDEAFREEQLSGISKWLISF